jgi:hypothetical protein
MIKDLLHALAGAALLLLTALVLVAGLGFGPEIRQAIDWLAGAL